MDLVKVDPVRLQARKAFVDRAQDPAARVAAAIGALPHREVHLGSQHDVVASSGERLTYDLLRLAGRVHVGGIDEVDAGVQRGVDDAGAVVVVRVADRAEHHGAEALHADLDAGAAERSIAHGPQPRSWSALQHNSNYEWSRSPLCSIATYLAMRRARVSGRRAAATRCRIE